jgi:hypothetical protein
MNTGRTNRSKYYEIEKWGPFEGKALYSDLADVNWWKRNGGWGGSNSCNSLSGSDGQQWHPGVEHDERLYVFNADACGRTLIEYEASYQKMNVVYVQ